MSAPLAVHQQASLLVHRIYTALMRCDLRRARGDAFSIAAAPEMVAVARAHIVAALGDEHPCRDAAAQVTSELVTNAIRYGSSSRRSRVRITVRRCRRGKVLLTVADEGGSRRSTPVIRRAGEGAMGGRGLTIVDALAAHWNCVPYGTGHKVRVRLDPRVPTPRASESSGLSDRPMPDQTSTTRDSHR